MKEEVIAGNKLVLSDTRQLISEITDEGLFERLAGSVLRIHTSLYQGICETGTNPSGRTIPDPADGIIYANTAAGEKYAIIVHHTISPRRSLRSKWLAPNKGDVDKALKLFTESKGALKGHKLRIILTCSTGPNSAVVTDLAKLAKNKNIEIEVWTGARIADVLDIKADGQWLRARTFGTPQQRISKNLVQEIGAKMLEAARPQSDPAEHIERSLMDTITERLSDSDNVLFLTGRSGIGKSVLCYDLAKEIERTGGICFVLTDQVLKDSVSLNEAIFKSLKGYSSNIVDIKFQSTLLDLFADGEVVLWVEDINRADSPADLLRKIIRWSESPSDPSNQGIQFGKRIRFLCPVWPEIIGSLSKNETKSIARNSIPLDEYSPSEGGKAVMAKAKFISRRLTALQAQEIATVLNHDPLLIGLLSDWEGADPQKIIAQYIDDETRALTLNSTYHKSEISDAIHSLIGSMLQKKNMSPLWQEVLSWTTKQNAQNIIRLVTKKSSIAHVNNNGRLVFRHDRIRDYLAAHWMAEQMVLGKLEPEFLNDPFFARIVGELVLRLPNQDSIVLNSRKIGALAKIYAFAASIRQSHSARNSLYLLCKEAISSASFRDGPLSEKWAINVVLASLDGEDVLELLTASPEKCFARQEGMARNGNVRAAAAFCYHHDPIVTSPRRDHLIKHLLKTYGEPWVERLGALIQEVGVEEKILEGALNLAGELGSEALIEALEFRWNNPLKNSPPILAEMLFAAISCAAGRQNNFLEEVIRHWASLPDRDPHKDHSNPRYEVAAYALRGGLKRHENDRVIKYLLTIPTKFPELSQNITTVLKTVDHPKAVTHVAEAVADTDRRCEGTQNTNIWGMSFTDNWGKLRGRNYRKMSNGSRKALKAIWTNMDADIWLRKRGFDLWSAWMPKEDIAYLDQAPPKGLEDRALAARLRHKDQTAKQQLSEKILLENDNWYWLQFARYVGTEGLEKTIETLFEKRREFFSANPNGYFSQDNILPELLGDRDDSFSFRIIKDNWEQLHTKSEYILALLYLATPESLSLANAAINEASEPRKILKYLDSRFGIKTLNRPGVTRVAQLEAVLPYFEHLGDMSKWSFWGVCNERGWYDWRKKNLDPRFEFPDNRTFPRVNEKADFDWLDKQLAIENRRDIEAHYWAKDRIECGITLLELVERSERYANSRQTPLTYNFFTDVIAKHGQRSDLSRLELPWALTKPDCLKAKEIASFSVRMRTCV